jgi:hypothetical protein
MTPSRRTASPFRLLLLAVVALIAIPATATAQTVSGKLAFVAIQPCRLVDTRGGAPFAPSEARSFNVAGATGFPAQGGNSGGCAIPGYSGSRPQVQAVALNVVAVSPQGPGHLVAWPTDQSEPLASVLNYSNLPGLNIANGLILPLAQDAVPGADLRVRAAVSGTHVVIDAVGYFTNAHRKYYLTTTTRQGATADTACAAGFHIASLWEIFDVTGLEYDVTRGLAPDLRGGPPPGQPGWIRSGTAAGTNNIAGLGNCDDWSSSSVSHYGTTVYLQAAWSGSANPISPWVAGTSTCNLSVRVWCVED